MKAPQLRRAGLRIDCLENRDVPAAISVAQPFDTTASGSIPAGFAQWSSGSAPTFSVASGPATSGGAALVSSGSASSAGRVWYATALQANAEVSANIKLDSISPTQLFVRGNNLNGTSASYYAATISTGLQASLNYVNGSTNATLGYALSRTSLNGQWVRVTLAANGSQLSLRIQRLDTMQYLGSNGNWGSTAVNALTVSDTRIAGGGFAGLGRAAYAAGNVPIDDFSLQGNSVADPIPTPTPVPPPVVDAAPFVSIATNLASPINGVVAITANASDDVGVAKVEFLIDGKSVASDSAAPYAFSLDTTVYAEGNHTLTVRASDNAGNVASTQGTFTIARPDITPPRVKFTSVDSIGAFSKTVSVTASASDNKGVARVEFWLDGQLASVDTQSPYAWSWDTTTVADGTHMLEAKAYDAANNVAIVQQQATVQNGLNIPKHYSHIRIAAIAYDGLTVTSTETKLLQNSVDLLIQDTKYLQQFESVAPNTPKLIYTNVSNLYSSLLTDWLNYADKSSLAREDAFYHVSEPTAFSGNSPSSQPVTWFWSVLREQADLTYAARSPDANDTAFGSVGQSIAFGSPDPFREINVKLTTGAANGWQGTWEYASAVDANGKPTQWKTLTLAADGTNGVRQSGRITFDPPSDWKAATLTTGNRLYYVRMRTTAAGTAPVATTVTGRDYVGANGGTTGTIPAFDANADLNHDGYLTDAEYASRSAGKDARFTYESRMFYPYYGQSRYVLNPTSAGVKNWSIDYHQRQIALNPLADGFFVDNSNGQAPFEGQKTVESQTNFTAQYADMLTQLGGALGTKWLLPNTTGGYAKSGAVLAATQASFEEFSLRPLSQNTEQVEEIGDAVATRLAAGKYVVLDSYPSGGSTTDPRTQIATLAYYYLFADADKTFLMFYGGYNPATSWTQHWSPAAAYDVGQAVGKWSVLATGKDPADTSYTYKVYQREYQNALVLYKPLSYKPYTSGTAADNTATTQQLNGTYRVLNSDGTLGASVTSIALRNGEGAVLIKVPS